MNEVKGKAPVTSVEHRERNGEMYIVINESAWYPANRYTDKAAAADYVCSHSYGGWGFIPRRVTV